MRGLLREEDSEQTSKACDKHMFKKLSATLGEAVRQWSKQRAFVEARREFVSSAATSSTTELCSDT
jgi:hypothetical protein